jgi:hypothetical protein
MATETAADGFVIEKWMAAMLARSVLALLVIAAVAYPVDWAVWRSRVAAGGGMEQILHRRRAEGWQGRLLPPGQQHDAVQQDPLSAGRQYGLLVARTTS